jgi:hypothetical protein
MRTPYLVTFAAKDWIFREIVALDRRGGPPHWVTSRQRESGTTPAKR